MQQKVIASLTLSAVAAVVAGCGSSTASTSRTTATPGAVSTSATSHRRTIVTKLPGTAGEKGSLATIARLPRLHRSAIQPRLMGFAGATLPDKLQSYATDVAALWNLEFQKFGPTQLPSATLNLIGQTPVACGAAQVGTSDPPEYCAGDGAIDLPLGTLATQIAPLGDAALLLVVSDLYGYHVENALGLLSSLDGADLETMDSCLSGVYFLYAEANQHLQASDEASINKLMALQAGPASIGSSPGGVTAAELTAAFNKGLFGHFDYRVCLPQNGGGGATTPSG